MTARDSMYASLAAHFGAPAQTLAEIRMERDARRQRLVGADMAEFCGELADDMRLPDWVRHRAAKLSARYDDRPMECTVDGCRDCALEGAEADERARDERDEEWAMAREGR